LTFFEFSFLCGSRGFPGITVFFFFPTYRPQGVSQAAGASLKTSNPTPGCFFSPGFASVPLFFFCTMAFWTHYRAAKVTLLPCPGVPAAALILFPPGSHSDFAHPFFIPKALSLIFFVCAMGGSGTPKFVSPPVCCALAMGSFRTHRDRSIF